MYFIVKFYRKLVNIRFERMTETRFCCNFLHYERREKEKT